MDAPVHCHFRASGEEFRLMVARVVGLGPTASSMPFEEKTRFRKRLITHLQRLMPPLMLSALVSGALPLIGRDRGLPAPKTAAPILSGVILALTPGHSSPHQQSYLELGARTLATDGAPKTSAFGIPLTWGG